MSLANPDQRRGLRSIIQALVVVAMIALVWFNIDRLDSAGTESILKWCLAILLVGTCGYIMENGLRAFNFEGWGMKASASNDAPAAAQAVADTAQATADTIKDAN